MARMTKANQALLEMSAKQHTWNQFRETYPERFAALMYEYMTLNAEGQSFSVDHLGSNVYLFIGKVGYPVEAKLMAVLTEQPINDYIWQFESIERVAQEYHEEVAEVARQAEIRRVALEKLRATLTDEEISLLGIG